MGGAFSTHTLPHTSLGLTDCISIVFTFLNILAHLTTTLPVMLAGLKHGLQTVQQNISSSPDVPLTLGQII